MLFHTKLRVFFSYHQFQRRVLDQFKKEMWHSLWVYIIHPCWSSTRYSKIFKYLKVIWDNRACSQEIKPHLIDHISLSSTVVHFSPRFTSSPLPYYQLQSPPNALNQVILLPFTQFLLLHVTSYLYGTFVVILLPMFRSFFFDWDLKNHTLYLDWLSHTLFIARLILNSSFLHVV